MKKEIEKLDNFGRGITYIDGKICFVDNALEKEIVKVKVSKTTKKYLLGEAVDFYRLSEDRIDEVCPYADVCGGCNISHMSFKAENKFKTEKVRDLLKKFANISSDKVIDITSIDELNYRNKVSLHGHLDLLGFYEKNSNRVIGIDNCYLADQSINKVIRILNDMAISNKISDAVIRCSNDSEEIMVVLNGEIDDYSELVNIVDTLIINGEVILGDESIISEIGSKKYYVSCESFFQVNKYLTEKLYDEVLNFVKENKPHKVLDLYCGTGTIGLYISDLVDEVVGVDYSKSGINDANKNKELNASKNIRFICDKVENVIDEFSNYDLVVVDPPRSGLDNKTIDNLKRINSKNIIYISCDPVTLSRDLKLLSDHYEVKIVKPYNMFPRTYHVETVAVLERR